MVQLFFFLFIILSSEPVLAQVGQVTQSRNVLNPEISLDGLFAAGYFSEPENLQFGAHDPTERGFTLQNLELNLAGSVDPYFRADVFLIFGIEDGESIIEVEEAYLTTLALPHRLQLIGGQFFNRFGRINHQHPHSWDFADQPIILNRLFGGDGLRNTGVQFSWLAPLPFYLEVLGSVQNANGETSTSFLFEEGEEVGGHVLLDRTVQKVDDLLYMGRLKGGFNPMDTLESVLGGSALFGPNASDLNKRTEIYGVDLYVKWRPLSAHRGFPFVSLQTEGLIRRYASPSGNLWDSGFYAQGLWGFAYRWVGGVRVEYGDGSGDNGADPLRDRRWRFSPNMTFYPSEFSKFRLQYNADVAEHLGDKTVHAVFLQFEFLIGTHGAHTF